MARRVAAAYGLIGEALALVHEQHIGLSSEAQQLLLLNTIAASKYLKLLLTALRPSLKSLDDEAVLVALADLGARYRPPVRAEQRSRVGYMSELLAQALRETAKVRRFLVCVGERRSVVVQALDEVTGHLTEARVLLDGRSVDILRRTKN
jgi:hypothetical protein